MTSLETELPSAKAFHLQLGEVATFSEADANKLRTGLQKSQARLIEVEQEMKLARKDFGESRKQSAGSAEAAEKSLLQLTKMSNRAQNLEIEVNSLNSLTCKVDKIRDDATWSANEKGREAKIVKSRISLLENELDFLKRKKPAACNKEVLGRMIADAKGEVNSLIDGLRRDTFNPYASIRHSVNQTLLAVGSRLGELTNRETQKLQRSVRLALCEAAGGFKSRLSVNLKLGTKA